MSDEYINILPNLCIRSNELSIFLYKTSIYTLFSNDILALLGTC